MQSVAIARALLGAAVVTAAVVASAPDVRGGEPTKAPSASGKGAQAFVAIASVLQSPRCMNCHPAGDAPLNGDHAALHRMNISRRSMVGLNCTTCHRKENGKALHSPPGAPNWRLPPDKTPLVFQGRSARELCEQLKDPQRNGEKSLAALKEHMGHDPFVLWGWSPGEGRSVPPLSHDDLMKNVDAWIADGAPCPN